LALIVVYDVNLVSDDKSCVLLVQHSILGNAIDLVAVLLIIIIDLGLSRLFQSNLTSLLHLLGLILLLPIRSLNDYIICGVLVKILDALRCILTTVSGESILTLGQTTQLNRICADFNSTIKGCDLVSHVSLEQVSAVNQVFVSAALQLSVTYALVMVQGHTLSSELLLVSILCPHLLLAVTV
jgi:hypothetical protein